MHKYLKLEKSFTLIELIIVIGILAIMAAVIILVLNPAQFLRESRDSRRMTELQELNKALGLYQADGGSNLGTANTVYVSIPDTSATCANLGLPDLPDGWSYACADEDNYQKTDGNGWVPVDFSSISFGTPFSILPKDPVNTTSTGNYYTYVTGGSWELTTILESDKYSSNAINDNDAYPGVLSIRTSLTSLTPGIRDRGLVGYWKFDEGEGDKAYAVFGSNNSINLSGSWVSGKLGGAYHFNKIATNFSSPIAEAVSYVFWFKLPDTSDLNGTFICAEDATDASREDNLGQINYGDKVCSGYGGAKNYSNFDVSDTDWYMFSLSKSANSLLCRNSSCVNKGDTTANLPVNVDYIKFNSGCGCGYGQFDQGSIIDEFRIYDRTLSEAEIQAIYDATR